jgi:hypothetical protein
MSDTNKKRLALVQVVVGIILTSIAVALQDWGLAAFLGAMLLVGHLAGRRSHRLHRARSDVDHHGD